MVYNEKLADRIRKVLGKSKNVTEKHMFGGLSFMYGKKMFCGILKEDLVLKLSHEQWEDALKKPNVRPMDFTGRPMKGFLYVSSGGYKTKKQLTRWVERSIDFVSKNKL